MARAGRPPRLPPAIASRWVFKERLVFYCRTTSASTAPCTPRRPCCTYAYVLITVLRVSRSCELFEGDAACHARIVLPACRLQYRGTSLIRNCPSLGPYGRPLPRALWWSCGRGQFLMSEVPLYHATRGSSSPLAACDSIPPAV